jgi:hypothetical protein
MMRMNLPRWPQSRRGPQNRWTAASVAGLIVLGVPACWDEPDEPVIVPDDAGTTDESAPIFPLDTGNTWTYRVTHREGTSTKINTVGPRETVGGTGRHATREAFRVETTRDGVLQTVSFRDEEGSAVVRYRELSIDPNGEVVSEKHWDPHKVHVDGASDRREVGVRWTERYDETQIEGDSESTETVEDLWTVDAVAARVTVPAGTFDALIFQRSDGTTVKTYWYVPGIGKVKETGGQTEELAAFDIGTP